MTDRRIITCEDCDGAGGHYSSVYAGFEERWCECRLCGGYGYIEVPTTSITMVDLDANYPGPGRGAGAQPYIIEDDSE